MTEQEKSALPETGALTFLFTDIEGSTRKAHELGENWFGVLETHHALLRPVFAAHGGVEVSTAGDSFFVVFDDAANAVAASVAMQRVIGNHDWSPNPQVKVRMGMHTGLARFRAHDNDYAGLTVHAASRVESAAAGAQVLITQATIDAAATSWPDGVDTLDLGFHRLKDLPAELQLFQIVADGLEREFPPVRGLDVVRNNVPVPPSNFIGRTDVLARLHHLLDDDRLVTVLGSGGTGKTRVALRLATERLHRHADGVWFVDLSSATTDADVVNAVANALDVREETDRSLLDVVADSVQASNVLLVVDNCEQVIDAAATVIERLLESGIGVRVLATSREPLELEGERLWPLAPLSVEEDGDGGEAVALLADRIALAQPDFELDDEARSFAKTIAARLDGLPLALELAAASTATLALEEIAQQLDDRFSLLTRGKRTAAERQKTLWGAIDWSYGLLSVEEQRLFRRLAVFPADFDFGVARAVCADDGASIDDPLFALQRKSLVTDTATARLRYLESIRAYAREQLASSGEADAIATRHARHFASEIEDRDAVRPEWVETIAEDLAAAMRWGRDHDQQLELQVLQELQRFWTRKGRLSEGRATSDDAIAASAGVESADRWHVIGNTGQIAMNQGDVKAAKEYFATAADMAERFGSPDEAELALGDLGQIALREGDVATAEGYFTRAVNAAKRSEEPRNLALAQAHLANTWNQAGELTKAWDLALDAVDVARSIQYDDLEFALLVLLGDIARRRGKLGEARRALDDALALARKLNNPDSTMYLLFCLASVEIDDGSPDAARPHLRDAITLGNDVGAHGDLCESFEATARVAAPTDSATAASLLATVDALRDRLGFARQATELPAYEALRAAVGDAPALALDDAVSAALAFLDDE